MSRHALRIAVGSLIIVELAAIVYVLSKSLAPSARAKNDAEVLIHLDQIVPGEPLKIRVVGRPLFVLRPTETQRESIARLTPHVAFPSQSNYVHELDAFVYWGFATNRGCELDHQPPQESHLRKWSSNAVWLGGFWSPWCDVSYDYAGRTISSWEFTFNGYNVPFQNLTRPNLSISGNAITVHML